MGLRHSHSLNESDERALARRWRARGDAEALEMLASAHVGLVFRLAQEIGARQRRPVSLDDLIQEGCVGLMIAARRFDPDAGTRLSTYATYWIRACLMEYVVRGHGAVRIGTTRGQRRVFFGLGRARRAIERSGGEATTAALAAKLDVSVDDVESMLPRLAAHDPSLDGAGEEERLPVAARLASDTPDPEMRVAEREETRQRRARFDAALRALPSRELAIIRARHLTTVPATLEDLGGRFGVSRERVRQLEAQAIARLRRSCKA